MRRTLACVLSCLFAGGAALALEPGTDLFVPSVAHGQGQEVNGVRAQWRADLWIFNPGTQAATVDLFLLLRNQANENPDSRRITVNPGEVRHLPDVILGQFGRDNTYGALRVTADRPVYVTGIVLRRQRQGRRQGAGRGHRRAVLLRNPRHPGDRGRGADRHRRPRPGRPADRRSLALQPGVRGDHRAQRHPQRRAPGRRRAEPRHDPGLPAAARGEAARRGAHDDRRHARHQPAGAGEGPGRTRTRRRLGLAHRQPHRRPLHRRDGRRRQRRDLPVQGRQDELRHPHHPADRQRHHHPSRGHHRGDRRGRRGRRAPAGSCCASSRPSTPPWPSRTARSPSRWAAR